jgi:hypothetical protein
MKKLAAALILIAGMTGAAFAHGTSRPQHGGVVRMSGETMFELVQEPAGVSLYVLEEDEPVEAAGMTARLTVINGERRTNVNMQSAADNKFVASGLRLQTGANVAVLVVHQASGARYGTNFVIQ